MKYMWIHHYTRYSERVFINHKRTRDLLRAFTQRNVTRGEATELKELIGKHAPSLTKLLTHLIPDDELETVTCPLLWKKFVQCLAASSPVCALVHPCEDHVQKLLLSIAHKKKEIINLEAASLHCLQQQFPILFELIHSLKSSTHDQHALQNILSAVLLEMLARAKAPFETPADGQSAEDPTTSTSTMDEIAFFPQLPSVRTRGTYAADQNRAKNVCTKLCIGHPTLLPGIFTLFCKHGMLLKHITGFHS